jgi:hypothetical protein
LDQAEDGFAEEGVDAIGDALIEDGDDGIAEDEGDEGVGALGAVFDVDGWRGEVSMVLVFRLRFIDSPG